MEETTKLIGDPLTDFDKVAVPLIHEPLQVKRPDISKFKALEIFQTIKIFTDDQL